MKNAVREIKKSKSRFFSIFGIIAIGVGFFAGIKAAAPDMKLSADKYFDDNNLADFRLVSTFGFDEDDITAINAVDIEKEVYPAYFADLLIQGENGDTVTRVMSLMNYGENNPYTGVELTEGRMPEKADECIIDNSGFQSAEVSIGKTITLKSGDSKGISQSVSRRTYTVVGLFNSPQYIDKSARGNTTIGSGSIKSIMYIPQENFAFDYYTEVYIRIPELVEYKCYSDEYVDRAAEIAELFEAIGNTRADLRYDEIIDEYSQKIADAEKELADGKQEADEKFDEAKQKLDDALADITDGEKEISDNEQKLADAKAELADARKTLDEGWQLYYEGKETYEKEIADGEKEIADNETKLVEAKKEYENGLAQYNDGLTQYNSKYAEYETALETFLAGEEQFNASLADYEASLALWQSSKDEYDAGYAQYTNGLEQYNSGYAEFEKNSSAYEAGYAKYLAALEQYSSYLAQYDHAETEYAAGLEQYNVSKAAYDTALEQYNRKIQDEGITPESEQIRLSLETQAEILAQSLAELNATRSALDSTHDTLETTKTTLDKTLDGLNSTKTLLDSARTQLAASKTQLDATSIQLTAAKTELDNGETKLSAAKEQLDAASTEIESGRAQLNEAKSKLDEAKTVLDESKTALDNAVKEIADGEKQLSDGKTQLENGKKEGKEKLETSLAELKDGDKKYSDGLAEITDGEKQLADAKKTLADGKTEYESGLAEYNTEKAKADKEIADGEKKVEDAKIELSELENPVWYVLDRTDNYGYSEYSDNADRINNIAQVFPVFFILVAGLVCLTTMTRMVDDQRTQIGTLKALGYSNSAIITKYLIYAISATVVGGLAGILIGMQVFPLVIMSAYKMLYNIPYMLTPIDFPLGIISLLVATAAVSATVIFSCKSALTEQSAQLMRPKAPKTGKRIFLEKITFLWKHFNFSKKVTARNIVRYKRRMMMTVIGVAGCTALTLTGFALKDSINDIVHLQYDEIFRFSGLAYTDTESENEHEPETVLDEYDADYMRIFQKQYTIKANGNNVSAYAVVPENAAGFNEYLSLRDRSTHNGYTITDGEAIVTEKMAALLGVKVGDEIEIQKSDTVKKSITISAICENYAQHFVYISLATFSELFGEQPEYNMYYFRYNLTTDEEPMFTEKMMALDSVLAVNLNSGTSDTFEKMNDALDMVTVFIILSAGALAFVVLYNLTNINISERIREIATLKVLGLYDNEVDGYIFRENIILTLMGTAVGLVLGIWLAGFVISTAEIDIVMFGRTIHALSYVKAAVITVGFSLIVTLYMHMHMKKIDMIEALKSVE